MALSRSEWTRALVEGDPALVRDLASEIEGLQGEDAGDIEMVDEPREELVMVQVRETAQGTLFYLGEALMTSCRVRVGGATGRGMLLGSNSRRAYELALADAMFSHAEDDPLAVRWERVLRDELGRIDAREAQAARRVARTEVDFSTMQEQ